MKYFGLFTPQKYFLTCVSMLLFYYKNISYKILKRLLVEPRIYIIVFFSLCNLGIDIGVPSDSVASSIIFLVFVLFVIFLDAVKLKSRNFLLIIIFNFVILNI